jgi:hypothetical protein
MQIIYSLIYSTHNGDDAPQTNEAEIRYGEGKGDISFPRTSVTLMKLTIQKPIIYQKELETLAIKPSEFPNATILKRNEHSFAYLGSWLKVIKVKVKQSRYRPGVAQRVPGS